MTDIVLAVPLGAASFQRAQEVVSEEVAARVREWPAVTQIVDSTAYIPLRTDWMPPRDRRTADGVELLLAGRWPVEVQAAIAAGRFARVSGRVIGEFWKCIAACGLSEDHKNPDSAVEEIYPEGEVDQDAPAARILSVPGEAIESVFPLDQIAKMGAAMALRMLEEYREKYPHLEIPGTEVLEMMGREDLVAMLVRAVTDPQVVAEARTQKARLDAALEAQERESRRPKIVLNDKVLNEKTSEAIDALQTMNDPPRLFVRAGRIVRVDRDEHGRAVIQTLNKAAVRGELDRAAHWVLFKPDKDKEVIETYVTPGVDIAEDLMERPPSEWGLPALIGIATSPILHLDGSIHGVEGYDPATSMYFMPEPGFDLAPVPANPTAADIAAAKEMILEMFWDFPLWTRLAGGTPSGRF